jgi:hypothetical protein
VKVIALVMMALLSFIGVYVPLFNTKSVKDKNKIEFLKKE